MVGKVRRVSAREGASPRVAGVWSVGDAGVVEVFEELLSQRLHLRLDAGARGRLVAAGREGQTEGRDPGEQIQALPDVQVVLSAGERLPVPKALPYGGARLA